MYLSTMRDGRSWILLWTDISTRLSSRFWPMVVLVSYSTRFRAEKERSAEQLVAGTVSSIRSIA